jgi:hypothetical protein
MRAHRGRIGRRGVVVALAAMVLTGPAGATGDAAGVTSLEIERGDDALLLSFAVRFELSRVVEDALLKGVPLHFAAEAELFRSRWYWTDKRVAAARRVLRLVYLPLTRQFRLSFGGLNQSFDELAEALAAVSRAASWRIADLAAVEPDARHYVEFTYRLDTSLLPRPMQIGIVGQPDWTLELRRTQRLD